MFFLIFLTLLCPFSFNFLTIGQQCTNLRNIQGGLRCPRQIQYNQNGPLMRYYQNIEPLANVFREEERNWDHENCDKCRLFRVGEVYAPPKPDEPRHEFVVDEEYVYEGNEEKRPLGRGRQFGGLTERKLELAPAVHIPNIISYEKAEIAVNPPFGSQNGNIEELYIHSFGRFPEYDNNVKGLTLQDTETVPLVEESSGDPQSANTENVSERIQTETTPILSESVARDDQADLTKADTESKKGLYSEN